MSDPSFLSIAVPATVGALVGTGVGILGIRRQFHRESKERYEGRLINALADVLKEISIYAEFSKSSIVNEAGRGDFPLLAAIDIAEMVARDEDLEMIQLIERAVLANRQVPNELLQLKLGVLSSGLANGFLSGDPSIVVTGKFRNGLPRNYLCLTEPKHA